MEILSALDAEVLLANDFLFGGGTRIVLELAGFRDSLDVDFLCSSPSGYGELRWRARTQGYAGLFRRPDRSGLSFPREMRVDQYGIRFPVAVNQNLIKVELIREGGIELGPGVRPDWSPVECLSITDCFAAKLLANSDRWADHQVLARDLIDVAAMRHEFGAIPAAAWEKAEKAYKKAPREDLAKAISQLTTDAAFQKRCFEGLRVVDPGRILSGIELLAEDLELEVHAQD